MGDRRGSRTCNPLTINDLRTRLQWQGKLFSIKVILGVDICPICGILFAAFDMNKLEIQKDGRNKWYARFRASGQAEAMLQSYSFYNHGATNVPEPEWRSEKEFVFLTSEAKLFNYFVNSTFWQLSVTGKQYKGMKGGWLSVARDVAVEKMMGLTFTTDIKVRKGFMNIFSTGTIAAERPDSDFDVAKDFKVNYNKYDWFMAQNSTPPETGDWDGVIPQVNNKQEVDDAINRFWQKRGQAQVGWGKGTTKGRRPKFDCRTKAE